MVYFGGFFAKLGHFAGFSLHIIYNAVRISEATMRLVGDILFSAWFFLYLFAERTFLLRTFPKLEFLFTILILPKGTAKLRWGDGAKNIFFRVQRSSEGCIIAQKGAA